MHTIASVRNPLLKEIRRAQSRGALTADGCAVAESFHLLEEALRSGCEVPAVLAAESVRPTVEKHVARLRNTRFTVLSDEVFESIASTESSQGVIALVRAPHWTLEQTLRGRSLVVVLDGVQDPGNAGTIVRSAEAFGSTGVVFLKGSVSPFNPKVLRGSAGSLFRLPVVPGVDPALAKAALQQKRLDVYAASGRSGRPPRDIDLTRRAAIIIGSEGRGVSGSLSGIAADITIPTIGVESLNAAVAASVILYEASRQRRAAPSVP
jgi:TrmH family RNA methyltransferase